MVFILNCLESYTYKHDNLVSLNGQQSAKPVILNYAVIKLSKRISACKTGWSLSFLERKWLFAVSKSLYNVVL
jgi:hypothetical protein